MMNNKGFAKYEALTVFALILIILAIGLNFVSNSGSPQKYNTMRKSAQNFATAVAGNLDAFDVYFNEHYLSETIDNEFIGNIKNPLGSGNCDIDESKVEVVEGKRFVTLKCGDYLIDNEDDTILKGMKIYKVGKWSSKKTNDDDQEVVVYNCKDNNEEVFDNYYQKYNFLYYINKKYNNSYTDISSIDSTCKVVEKTMYRTKELVDG